MKNLLRVLPLVAFCAALAGFCVLRSESAPTLSDTLSGTVKSVDGKPMEGVTVTARAEGQSFTTAVFSNAAGEYAFPQLGNGKYLLRAQAVGYGAGIGTQDVVAGKKIRQDFQLKPIADFHHQLSATEWAQSMPEDTPADQRAKQLVHYNCSSCHVPGFILSKRFDAAGWGMMINYMLEREMSPNGANHKLIQAYKEDLVSYLTKIRGPKDYPWKFQPQPRPAGEATRVVVTEFDLTRGDEPHSVNDGSDWMEGIPSKYEGEGSHDLAVDHDSNIFFTDNSTPERTIGKLNPRTGELTGYVLRDKDGFAVRTHGSTTDPAGNIWLTNGTDGTILKFDPRTEKFQNFLKPADISRGIGPTIITDSKGNVWATQSNGVFRLNPQTGEYTEFKSFTKGGNPYGIAVDAEDNVWFAQITGDRVGYVNAKTGEVGEVVMPAAKAVIEQKDREIGERSGAITNAAPLWQKGPRRMGADRRGNAVWVAEYWTGQLAKIDIHTKKVTEYAVPAAYSHPYAVVVDKNHMVWVSLMNSDRVARFDPKTEKFTEFPLGSLGTEARFIDVDDRTPTPTLWLPYTRNNRIGRVEFLSN